jgi:hypothetical protein
VKARGAQDYNIVNANGGACFYKQESSTFCHIYFDKMLPLMNGSRKNVWIKVCVASRLQKKGDLQNEQSDC